MKPPVQPPCSFLASERLFPKVHTQCLLALSKESSSVAAFYSHGRLFSDFSDLTVRKIISMLFNLNFPYPNLVSLLSVTPS